MFATHDENNFYKECRIAYLKLCPVPSNSIAPEVETWKSKISKNFNAELCSKFVASNLADKILDDQQQRFECMESVGL